MLFPGGSCEPFTAEQGAGAGGRHGPDTSSAEISFLFLGLRGDRHRATAGADHAGGRLL